MLMKLGYSIGKRISISDLTCSKAIAATFFIKNSIPARRHSGRASPLSLFHFSPLANWVGRLPPTWFSFKNYAEILNLACAELKVHRWIRSSERSLKGRLSAITPQGFVEQLVPFSQGGGSCSMLGALRKGKCVWDFNSTSSVWKPSVGTFCPLWLGGQPQFPVPLKMMARQLQRAFAFVLLTLLEYFLAFGLKIRQSLDAFFLMTILEAAGTVILPREETYYLEKYFEKSFGITETCGHRRQQESRTGEQRKFGGDCSKKEGEKGVRGSRRRWWRRKEEAAAEWKGLGLVVGNQQVEGQWASVVRRWKSILRWGHLFHRTLFGMLTPPTNFRN